MLDYLNIVVTNSEGRSYRFAMYLKEGVYKTEYQRGIHGLFIAAVNPDYITPPDILRHELNPEDETIKVVEELLKKIHYSRYPDSFYGDKRLMGSGPNEFYADYHFVGKVRAKHISGETVFIPLEMVNILLRLVATGLCGEEMFYYYR